MTYQNKSKLFIYKPVLEKLLNRESFKQLITGHKQYNKYTKENILARK